ncbi:hypothetical protein AK830_g10660 [Neonectria ditissima]|uniref:Uncharacterized protein n=1 Tax=Neonectria ditissima TaxID=78410 RepID=A0A0P7B382_9HYPO|nr:hypothetical protein AK830_g10660 [Neonectria ditissima]
MEDAVRPSQQAAKAMFGRGYRTWAKLSETACSDKQFERDCLSHLQSAFPNHPHFPQNLEVDNSFSNTIQVKGWTTWACSEEAHNLPSFQDEILFAVATDAPTPVVFTSDVRRSTTTLPEIFGLEGNHIPILMQAWTYILSARWAELIPGACVSQEIRTNQDFDAGSEMPGEDNPSITVNVGAVDQAAANWWTVILSADGGWNATIRNPNAKGGLLHSPWSTKFTSEQAFVILAEAGVASSAPGNTPTSAAAARRYLSDYCDFHGINDQSQAALTAALLIPVAKYHRRPIELALPRLPQQTHYEQKKQKAAPSTIEDPLQLDRLLTLSCNARGVKALLGSVFFEPDVHSNICGFWLQGSFTFLNAVKDPHALLRVLMKRDPELGFLWLGAFITGTHTPCLRAGRGASWSIDLSAAAWTGTYASFIQAPVPMMVPKKDTISRADECRLLYLAHEMNYTTPPLFPFAPFGSTALDDTAIEVREHVLCGRDHSFQYECFTWACKDRKMIEQGRGNASVMTIRPKNGQILDDDSIIVDYDDLDSEDENSEAVTRNIFTWLRGKDGFPVAEREIRAHEWIDNLDSDDDSPIEGDVQSTAGGHLHGWLIKTLTQRANSI